MAQRGEPGAERFVPESRDLRTLESAAASCEGCELYRDATQTVFGSGPSGARVLLLGEQPGDREDREGEPFVGPAGHVLDRALAEAGLREEDVYRTNAVKHFRWRPAPQGGKRRIHQSPTQAQITACRPWLLAELNALHPAVIVALGGSAGKSLFGSGFRVGDSRGTRRAWSPPGSAEAGSEAGAEAEPAPTIDVVTTIHPSAVLRADDREAAFDGLVADLRVVGEVLR